MTSTSTSANYYRVRSTRFGSLALVCSSAILLSGCNRSSSPFESVSVSGKVTYEDGSPIPVTKLYFYSLQPPIDGMHPRPATVGVGPDGSFSDVTTYKYADGLVLGEHKVALFGDLKKLPKDCTDPTKTPLRVQITDSGQVLEIKVPKPAFGRAR